MPKVELSTIASYVFEGHDATVVRDSQLLNSKDVIVMPNGKSIRSLYRKTFYGPITNSWAALPDGGRRCLEPVRSSLTQRMPSMSFRRCKKASQALFSSLKRCASVRNPRSL